MIKNNIYATCVDIQSQGILIIGKSGSGKSDLALRLIEYKNAILVSDDRTEVYVEQGKLFATQPQEIKGLLEVRGVGIIKQDCIEKSEIKLVVNLVSDLHQIERMPIERFYEINGISIPLLYLYPFELSAVDKVVIKLKANLEK